MGKYKRISDFFRDKNDILSELPGMAGWFVHIEVE